jgi:hypothetical protein
MIILPTNWTLNELTQGAATAAVEFREGRLVASNAWETQFKLARGKFEKLFKELGDLNPKALNLESLAKAYGHGLGEALRYLAGPPISDDDLQVIADVDSIAPGVLKKDPAALKKVFDVIQQVIDPHRFPWLQTGRTPTKQERDAALLASAVLLAAQRLATTRRNEGKKEQEKKVKDYLRGLGFTEVKPVTISTIVKGPEEGQFCAECLLGDRKADVVVRLPDTRLMPIECKVSNSATNSVKRLNNDAAVKGVHWIKKFGEDQVVPAALLAGVFKVLNLEQAQDRGLSLFWSHDLGKLGDFIQSTIPIKEKK